MVVGILLKISEAFVLGLLTPLTAACVLPLYPGFLVYLSNQLSGKEADRKTIALFGIIITGLSRSGISGLHGMLSILKLDYTCRWM